METYIPPCDLHLHSNYSDGTMPPEELVNVKKTLPDFPAALAALGAKHEFLLKGDVFTEDVIRTWIDFKRENEIIPMMIRPHPFEFCLYFDI